MIARAVRRLALAAFWSATAAIVAGYAVLPAVIVARGRLRPRAIRAADHEPTVTVVIAAHDEEAAIGGRLENLAALDYPRDRLDVVVASDGSTDGTNGIVAGWPDPRVRLLPLPRVGKADALNAAVAAARGEIIVFSDANSLFRPDAIRAIVRPFADPEVGGAAGDQRYAKGGDQEATAIGERHYWDLDRILKVSESAAGNVISATGAIYAVRRELVPTIVSGVTDDFFTSTAVVAAGRRLVFAEDAIAVEPVAATRGIEFGRKVRVMTRGLRGVVLRRELLDPRRTGFYAVQLAWHKLLRRLMVLPLLVVAASSVLLWPAGRLYRLAVLAQAWLYGLAAVGVRRRIRADDHRRDVRAFDRIAALAAYFCLVNAAALVAAVNVLRGRRIDRWEPQRPATAAAAERTGEPRAAMDSVTDEPETAPPVGEPVGSGAGRAAP
jgi:cellulose synthase/poly-beta-1,6-N-acetylglucosamine synthase-like glycosyltransferase